MALHTGIVDHPGAPFIFAFFVHKGISVMALSAAFLTVDMTPSDETLSFREFEEGKTRHTFLSPVKKTPGLILLALPGRSQEESWLTLVTARFVVSLAVRHLREGVAVSVDQLEMRVAC